MLEIKDLFVSYGMMEVLHGISLNVQPGELVSVIGPNGAGKTTLIKTIMGLVQPKSGTVLYDGQDISHIPAHKRAEMGIGYVPEGRHVFGRLTVEENLAIGAYSSKDKETLKKNIEMVYDIFPRLGERRELRRGRRPRERRLPAQVRARHAAQADDEAGGDGAGGGVPAGGGVRLHDGTEPHRRWRPHGMVRNLAIIPARSGSKLCATRSATTPQRKETSGYARASAPATATCRSPRKKTFSPF